MPDEIKNQGTPTDLPDGQVPEIREALDAESHEGLKRDPTDEDAKLDVALDESFPTSDAPANTAPGAGEPALSSGYDEEAERKLAAEKDGKDGVEPGDPGDAPSDSPTQTQA